MLNLNYFETVIIRVRIRISLQAENGKDIDLSEVGPRFQLRLYEIKLGTLESSSAADTEWALRPYMNTAKKRRFLSDEDGFEEDL